VGLKLGTWLMSIKAWGASESQVVVSLFSMILLIQMINIYILKVDTLYLMLEKVKNINSIKSVRYVHNLILKLKNIFY